VTLLSVRDLSVSFGGIRAIENVSLTVAAGQIVTVIGPNGAGKSTMLGAISGILPSTGSVRFDGAAIEGEPVEARVGRGLSLVPEKRELFATMTVAENLRLGGYRLRSEGWAAASRAMESCFALFPRLAERRRQVAGTLSGGERQMLAMARALMARPSLLMLDEPSLGLAPLIVRDIFQAIVGLRQSGVAILLVEQNARAALAISDYGYVLEGGKIALEGDSAHLSADQRIVEMYLGAMRTA
jgi:branched-chain amino acid transport system ATP-binding protein